MKIKKEHFLGGTGIVIDTPPSFHMPIAGALGSCGYAAVNRSYANCSSSLILFSVVSSDRTRGNRHKLKQGPV